MKKDVHPEYREVLFHDTSIDKYFVVPSSLVTDETKEWEGKTYPYFTLDPGLGGLSLNGVGNK